MLCYNCKEQTVLPNRRLCQDCLDTRKERQNRLKRESYLRLKQQRSKTNVCSTCGQRPAASGFVQCQRCKDKKAKDQVRLRQKRREASLCSRCGKNPATSGTNCKECRTKTNTQTFAARRRKNPPLIAKRLCIECETPNDMPEFLTCPTCRAERRDKATKKRLTGLQYSILERDGFACQLCGIDKYFHVHHIDGNGTGSPKPNDDPDNLITLCRMCHHAITVLRTHQPKKAANLILT